MNDSYLKSLFAWLFTGMFALVATQVIAQDLYVYPAKKQSDEQLKEDRYQCHIWAVNESHFDPTEFREMAPPRMVKVPVGPNPKEGATGKGILLGALAGGVIGSHDSTAGQGAAIGAMVGALAGSAVEAKGQETAEDQARQRAEEIARTRAEKNLRRSDYRRALTACLEGRGYTVK